LTEKRKVGGQPENLNHVHAVEWPKEIDLNLSDPETILAFQAKLAYLILTGAISDRKGGALNNLLAIRLRYFLDAKRMKELESKVGEIVKLLPEDMRKQLEGEAKV
jgi:hypothetical protein